jgi:DNA-binding NarL/FixJ family response regulator
LITVVVCDDHQVVAEGLAAVLGAEPDIEVVAIASSVAMVLELAERFRPDVVLMDYELPDGDGVAATRALKAAHPEVMILMLTSYSDEGVLVSAVEAGCSGYLTKHDGSHAVANGVRVAASGEAVVTAAMLSKILPRLSRAEHSKGATELTTREHEVLELLADGLATAAIAERLYLSVNTVRNHAQSILVKLGVHSRLEAVSVAVRAGMITRS